MNWFKLNTGATNPYLPANYTLNNNPGCVGSETLCSINAQTDANNKPIITGQIQTAITNALNGIITPNVTQLRAA